MQHAKKNSVLANSHQPSPPGPREGTVVVVVVVCVWGGGL